MTIPTSRPAEQTITARGGLTWDGRRLMFDGKPEVVLGASVFYFRLAREDWAGRLAMVKAAGYNTIDVYFPWNFHEPVEGEWDFTGRRDVAHFLDLAQAVGLKVIARPGPYICSEWEGGGLPAWLIAKGVALRQNDPGYLGYVRRWFDRILPLLASRQASHGPVILLQIENELDFFPCRDVPGYLGELYRMARERGITVPVTACLGRGDLEAATGNLEGLWPTVNLYPPDDAPGLEEEVEAMADKLRRQDLPLIITETGRSHLLLRRLLAGGAKGVSAFLQVGGDNFGLYEAVNDWRDPGAFLATVSDFGGMIDDGGRIRPEYYRGRLLGLALGAVKDFFAAALPAPPGTVISWNDRVGSPTKDGRYAVRVLRVPEGPIFVMPANLQEVEQATRFSLGELTVPRRARLVLPPGTMPIFPFHLDLRSRGAALEIVYALSEPVYLDRMGETLVLVAHGPEGTEGEILLRGRVGLLYVDEGISIREEEDNEISLRYPHDRERFCRLETDSGPVLFVLTSSRRAGRLWPLCERDGRGWLLFGADYVRGEAGEYDIRPGDGPLFLLGPGIPEEAVSCLQCGDLNWTSLNVEPGDGGRRVELLPTSCEIGPVAGCSVPSQAGLLSLGRPPLEGLEAMGLGKGMAWYRTRLKTAPGEVLFYAEAASDVVSVYMGQEYLGTYVPWGEGFFCPLQFGEGVTELTLRVEIWGHSNFHHSRHPALALGSPRGLLGRTQFLRLWRRFSAPPLEGKALFAFECPRDAAEAVWVLKVPPGSPWVEIDGRVLEVRNGDGYVALPDGLFRPGQASIVVPGGGPVVEVSLYRGFAEGKWEIHGLPAQDLPRWKTESRAPIGLPLYLAPGSIGLLHLRWPEFPWDKAEAVHLVVDGRDCKLTVYIGSEVIGRLWLPSSGRPPFAGGMIDGWLFVPRALLATESEMRLIVEAVGERPGLVNSVHLDAIKPCTVVKVTLPSGY